ncbi:GMC family oxidoreductase [Brachybacterium sp. GCM10030268]|uniref:GMC family oxidoreductase n=1 Tax=Brachybacterium sp. GCM10030268 TaxID=3273382 RepID=UPI0036088A13
MAQHYDADAIVVGSGFGGAVAAARLAQAGLSVIVLERGRRWALGEFPRRPELEDRWLWRAGQGLYDIRWLDTMGSVQAAGWGGGSLVYANVFSRPYEGVMDERWPSHLRRESLDPYYELAGHMMGIAPAGDDPATGRPAPRTSLIEQMVQGMDIPATVRPSLAVTFGDPETWHPNVHGVPRRGCAFVGECIIGCNHGAKNTLDVTYLAVAEQHGARAVTDAEVRRIETHRDSSGRSGYAVTTTSPTDPSAPPRTWTAPRVVLAAGAAATNELLLRARDVHGTLPDLSPQLGRGFSGNGDFLTLAEMPRDAADMTTGPTITTTTVLSVPEGGRSVWFQVQDGAIPPPLQELYDALLPGRTVRRWWKHLRGSDPTRTFALLAMGRDSARGTLRLDDKGEAALSWSNRWQAHLYRSQRRVGPLVRRLLGGRQYNPPTWSLLRRTITVHPLGGVRPGADAASGVVDDIGQVHGYPGLYVMDGSVVPAATGVNPSATILAGAERAIEAVIRAAGRPEWRAPEWDAVQATPVPEDGAFAHAAAAREATRGDGVVFAEHMATPSGTRPRAELRLRAEVRSMDGFLTDHAHPIAVHGSIDLEGIATGAETAGTLSLFPRGGDEAMRYSLEFADDDGRPRRLIGVKHTSGRRPLALLAGLTTLHIEVSPADGADGAEGVADGADGQSVRTVLRISAPDLVRLLTSIRGQGFTRARRLTAAGRFAGFFVRSALARPRRRVASAGPG